LFDVGGASGNMLAAVLSHHAGLRGILFAGRMWYASARPARAQRRERRVKIEAGAFSRVFPRADAYILSHIIMTGSRNSV